ncbi:MAG: serine protease [Moraxellaceae bacterium]|nr:MAG: serine protease [Moraxellaceae bacterium]
MKTIPFNKHIVLSVLLAVVIVTILNRIIPPHVDPVFNVVVSKNRTSISDIHQPRDVEMSKQVKVDRINLADKSRFRHAKLGDIGYAGDFFVDIDAPFTVKKAGEYSFYVGSDDGFALSVDNKKLCEWTHDRPLTTDACHVQLSEGSHTFKLVYFQGYGNAGLVMSYGLKNDSKQYLAGDNSKYISFDK